MPNAKKRLRLPLRGSDSWFALGRSLDVISSAIQKAIHKGYTWHSAKVIDDEMLRIIGAAKQARDLVSTSRAWSSFNCNNSVKFRLTPRGRLLLGREDLIEREDGWVEMELWRFASIIGPYMDQSALPVIEMDIQL